MASVFDGIKPVVEERLSPAKTPFFTSVDCNQRDVLIEGEFIELNDHLWIDKHVRILVTSEFLYLTEEGSKNQIKKQSHVLQPDPAKTVLKFNRSDIVLELIEGCQYTFKAKWSDDETWKTYRLCGQVSDQEWLKWIRCFQLCTSHLDTPVPMAIPETVNTDISSSDDEDDEAEAEEVSLPKCLPLCVDRAMSMLSMTMLNPSNVRKLAFSNLQDKYQKTASLGTIGSENEDVLESVEAGTLFPSTSYPRLSFTKPFCTFSLMNVSELENVNIDNDLKSKRGLRESLDQGYVQQIKSKSINKQRRTAKFQNITATEITLQNRIDHLRAHPSNLNFVRRHLWDEKTLSVPSAVHNRRLSLSLALTCDSNRIPQSTEHLQLGDMNPAKRALQRTESSPARQLYMSKPTATPIIKTPVARRLNFKDDMAIDVNVPDQKPQKAKVRRFLTILQKKRTRNHPPLPEIPFSPAKDLSNTNVNTSPSKLRRIKSFSAGSTGRSRRHEELSPSKEAKKDKVVLNLAPLQSSSPDSVNESPLSRKGSTSSSSGSARKKFVQRILSPILKSSALDESEVGRSLSPTEVPFSPDFGDVLLNGGPRGLVDIDSITFAKEITLIDKELFVRILWHELESCGWMTKDKYVRSPNVMEIVEFFNRIALLVATEILAEETPQARARVISKVIQIADKCRLLGNFNSLKALMAGLQSTPLYRMKETWKEVSSKRKKKFRDLSILMGESDNFALYRKEMANCLANGPCLPFLGDFLTQIAQSQAFMSVKRKRQKTAKEIQPNDSIDGEPVNGVTKCNGLTPLSHNEVNSCPTTPREFSPDTSCDLIDEKRETTVTCSLHDVFSRDRPKRSSSRMKLRRFYSRQNSTEIDTPFNHNRNHSAELLDVHRFKSKLMPASSDSVISNSNSSNSHYGNSPRTPSSGRPPLLRRMSESASSSFFSGGFSGKPKRRFSESSKSSKPRRFFLDGLVRRSTSSNSVKDSRAHKGITNDVLGHSVSTQSIREGSVNSHEVLGKSVSTPLIKDGCNLLSRDISRDVSRDCSCEQLEISSTFDEERWQSLVRSSDSSNIVGTELQLIKYQMAAVQYDFISNPEVRQFLLNASFNTEEENYRLSLKREPPVKAT